jgi:hypothetical protein
MNTIKLQELIHEVIMETLKNESKASEEAKRLGLEKKPGFGAYGPPGKPDITHLSRGDKLVPTNSPQGNQVPSKPTQQSTPDTQAPTTTPPGNATKFRQPGDTLYTSVDKSLAATGLYPDTRKAMDDLLNKGYVPLTVKTERWRSTRGDGIRHHGWTTIVPNRGWTATGEQLKKNPLAAHKTMQYYLQSIKAKPIGKVSDWAGSSKKADVYSLGNTIFVNRGDYIEVGSKSRFKNSDIWRREK